MRFSELYKSILLLLVLMFCQVGNIYSDDEFWWFKTELDSGSDKVVGNEDSTGKKDEIKNEKPYQINAGDIIEINVWREPDLNKEFIVRPDGAISVPLIGEIHVRDKTIDVLQKLITAEFEKFIPEPVVTVSTKSIMGNKVFVVGNVNRPGEIIMNQRIDVMQALGIAGGISTFAAENDIKILRRKNNVQIVIPFRYGDISKGESLEQNILLVSGDVLIVP